MSLRAVRENTELEKWDPEFTGQLTELIRPFVKRYFRAEVIGLDHLPATGGALLVSNHSGGTLTPDVFVFGTAYYEHFGYDRPLYTLGHDSIFVSRLATVLARTGVIHATRENAAAALRSDGVVLVFPAATTTHTVRAARRTSSTSTAGRAMSERLSKPVCRSCPPCRSALRTAKYS